MISGRYCAAVVSWSLAAMVRVCSAPESEPLGEFEVAVESAGRTSSIDRPTPASAPGAAGTRTARRCPPPTRTRPPPGTREIFFARMGVARSDTLALRNDRGGGEDHGDGEQRGRHRPPDEGGGDVHDAGAPAGIDSAGFPLRPRPSHAPSRPM